MDFPQEPLLVEAPMDTMEPKQESAVTDTVTKDEEMHGDEQNGNNGAAWNGGQHNDGHTNEYQNNHVEESRPIGIKEDG